MLIKIIFAFFIVGINFSHASTDFVTDPFEIRYKMADAVVYGEVLKDDPSDVSFPELGNYTKDKYRKAKFKVVKSWKGKVEPTIDVYTFTPYEIIKGLPFGMAVQLSKEKKTKHLLFLRKINNKFFVTRLYGYIFIYEENHKPEDFEDYRLLEAMKKK